MNPETNRTITPRPNKPDHHAMGIAQAVQKAIAPGTVILFGSRAVGDHREDSDVDLLIVLSDHQHPMNTAPAGEAAMKYMKSNPPVLDVNIRTMTKGEFNRRRRAAQHLAGQAAHHGVIMSGERTEYSGNREDEYPDHWPATRKRLENAAEHQRQFNELVEQDHWNRKLMGYTAQQAVENALKGWLSTFNDPSRFSHDLNRLWDHLKSIQDWKEPKLERLYESLNELFDHTMYHNPRAPSGRGNWLTDYADSYRYDVDPRPMSREEKLHLHRLVNNAVEDLTRRINQVSGTTEGDIFPEGKPWEQETNQG